MRILALDIGTKRIGTAFADTSVRIAVPRGMIPVDGDEFAAIAKQYQLEKADLIVAGLPRNSQGEETKQSQFVRDFVDKLHFYFHQHELGKLSVILRDESLSSVTAEERFGGNISREERAAGKVDAEAAAIILQDFLDATDNNQLEKESHESK